MSKRKQGSASQSRSFQYADDRIDYIRIGTEFLSDRQQRQLDRRQHNTWDKKPKDYSRDAFKGGFTAGYHNTVGSKEGWQPAAAFTSSRASRSEFQQMRPEDFMDKEDLADIKEAQAFAVTKSFSKPNANSAFENGYSEETTVFDNVADKDGTGIVSSIAQKISAEFAALDHLAGKDRGIGDTLLGLMGWKPGQGIGPLSRNAATHGLSVVAANDELVKLPPRPTSLVLFKGAKLYKHGIDYGVESSMLLPDASSASTYDEPALPALGALFKPRANDTAIAAVKPKSASKKKLKKKANSEMMRLSFSVLDNDDDDNDGDTDNDGHGKYMLDSKTAGNRRPRDISETHLGRLARIKANPAASKNPLSLSKTDSEERSFCFDGKPPLPGFLLFGSQNKAIIQFYHSPQVPDAFTGFHDQRQLPSKKKSRWDVQLSLDSETADKAKRQNPVNEPVSQKDAENFAHTARLCQPSTALLSRFRSVASIDKEIPSDGEAAAAKNNRRCRASAEKQVVRKVQEWAPSQILCKRMKLVP
ncbi:hypothetical protein FB639_001182, partial [Coemansia asiatica]